MSSYVKALYEFSGEPGSSEISIKVGEILSIIRTDVGEGWWEGKNCNGDIGLFPAAYVEVMGAAEVKQQQSLTDLQNSGARYDSTTDEFNNEGDDWEDDWDDENETYSEIGPSNSLHQLQTNSVMQSVCSYDTKFLPVTPGDDISIASVTSGSNTATLKKSSMFGKSTDSFILGLGNRDRLTESEKVQIVPFDNFYQWQPNIQSYCVIVDSPKKESKFKGMKTFIAYQLTPSFNNISVFRRYKHFDWLHERMVDKFCLIPIPPLPDKQISGRYEEQFVEHRRVQLQEFVDWVCRHPVLSRCKVWHHFLTCTDDKVWKMGKRKAEKDSYVGITYCWAISPPEKQLLQSYVDSQMESCFQFIHSMDLSIRNMLSISNDMTKRFQTQTKKEFQRVGDGLLDLSRAIAIDERRAATLNSKSLSESLLKVGDIFGSIGLQAGEQPKLDWIPFSDRLHIYSLKKSNTQQLQVLVHHMQENPRLARGVPTFGSTKISLEEEWMELRTKLNCSGKRGVLSTFPDILSIHKGAMQKRKECERLVAEQKMSNSQMAEVNRRTDVISYAVIAEMSHFRAEQENHLKQTLKSLVEEQVKFYSSIVSRLQEAHMQIN